MCDKNDHEEVALHSKPLAFSITGQQFEHVPMPILAQWLQAI